MRQDESAIGFRDAARGSDVSGAPSSSRRGKPRASREVAHFDGGSAEADQNTEPLASAAGLHQVPVHRAGLQGLRRGVRDTSFEMHYGSATRRV